MINKIVFLKRIAFLFFFFFYSFNVLAISTIDSLKQQINNIEVSQKMLLRFNDSIIKNSNDLKEKVSYQEKLLTEYDSLNSNTFNIINMLIGFFGIVVPIAGYFFVVQPSREKVKEAQKMLDDIRYNMKQLFSDYLSTSKDELIDNAISNYENNNTSQISNSYHYLDKHKHEGFNDKQILRLIKLVKANNKDIYFFLQCLVNTESVFTTDFFLSFIKSNDPENELSTWVAIYAAKYDKEEFIESICEYIIKQNNLTGVGASINSESNDFLIKVYNCEKLLIIDDDVLRQHMNFYDNDTTRESSTERDSRHKTKLYEKYLKLTSR